jgi:hypothetical protein
MEWFKKKRVLPRWRLMGILFFAIGFGFTLALSMQDGERYPPFLIALCGVGFAYDKSLK